MYAINSSVPNCSQMYLLNGTSSPSSGPFLKLTSCVKSAFVRKGFIVAAFIYSARFGSTCGDNSSERVVHGFSGEAHESFGKMPDLLMKEKQLDGWDMYPFGFHVNINPEHGKEVPLDINIAIYSWHSNHHLAHIVKLKERMAW